MNNSELNKSLQYLKFVGPKRAESFNSIGINTVRDLMFYFPTRYLDRRTTLSVVKIFKYVGDGFEGEVTLLGKVTDVEVIRYGKKQLLKVVLKDNTGFFECVWFHGINYFKSLFKEDDYYAFSSKPVITKYGHLQLAHPDFDKITNQESDQFINTGKIIPFYKLPKELKSKNLGDVSLRKIIQSCVNEYSIYVNETLPKFLLQRNHISSLQKALKEVHNPSSTEELLLAQKRFKYEELFYLEVLIAHRKYNFQLVNKGINYKINSKLIKKFVENLPFNLTNDQKEVSKEILSDMKKPFSMNRMLQGDVGSGKTIVSIIAILVAIDNGYQCILMAPTEILATQHFNILKNLLNNFNINISLLLGGQSNKKRNHLLKEIHSGVVNVVVGTHALFEEKVEFKNPGLIVIDEQHRFGVMQRSKLISKGLCPDVLIMTATPIPRTLSMTLYGDLDVSYIRSLPEGRKVVKTYVRNDNKLPDIYEYVKNKAHEGVQSFIVYPLVQESEKIELKAAEDYFQKLSSTYFKDINVCLLHGKMTWSEKINIMNEFKEKKYSILISTSVIEVGIDIPDANIMVVNDAERFGLAQLHQLRGRVGRSNKQAFCILVSKYNIPDNYNFENIQFDYLSKSQIERNKAMIRLAAMKSISDGFTLSEIDFKLRGPGNIFGKEQSGFPALIHADIINDSEILLAAKNDAFTILENDMKLNDNQNKIIKLTLNKYYSNHMTYSTIA